MIHIDISDALHPHLDAAILEKAAQATLTHQHVHGEAGLSVAVRDDDDLQTLNRQFRGVDAPTDVLAFPAELKDPQTGIPYLGDVVLSLSRAEAQARLAGHSLEAELQLLTVHGVLHLLGHDHLEADEKARMWQAQREILASLGVGAIRLPE